MKWKPSAFGKDTVELTDQDIQNLLNGESIQDGACVVRLSGQTSADTAIRNMIRNHQVAIEELTEQQAAEAFKQACSCGDFQRLVRRGDSAQSVIYIPFAREEELQSRIQRLEKALTENNIPDPDRIGTEANCSSV